MQPVKRLPYVPDTSATSTQQFDDRSRYASLVGSLILGSNDATKHYVDGQTACSTSKSTISYPLEDRKGVAPLSQVYQTCNTATHEVFRRFGFAYVY